MSDYIPENPLIVQSDQTVLLEIHSPRAAAARDAIAPFAELIKSPEHVHTYRITPLSIWNARAAGLDTDAMIATLREYAKYSVPEGVAQEIRALGRRYGLAVIERDEIGLILRVADAPLAELLARDRHVAPLLGERVNGQVFRVRLGVRGLLKQALVAIGYPADDLAGYSAGQELPLRLRETTGGGGGVPSGGSGAGRQWGHRVALRRGQDHCRYGGDGAGPGKHPDFDYQPDLDGAMAAGVAGQN
jgi:DNA excision repair protein ERCC-3